jgi:hypothetical protein
MTKVVRANGDEAMDQFRSTLDRLKRFRQRWSRAKIPREVKRERHVWIARLIGFRRSGGFAF